MQLYFDTSIYNRLLDDPDRESIIATFVNGPHEIYVSTLNIIEMAATSDTQRREALLKSANQLRRNGLPLDYPRNLLRRSLEHFLRGEVDSIANNTQADANILQLIRDPGCLDPKWHADVVARKAKEEAWYDRMHKDARDGLQRLIRDLSPPDAQRIQANAPSFIRNVCDRPDFLEDFFADVFARLGFGTTLRGRASEILHNVGVWCFYFKALAYGVYDRTVKQERYGRDSNPGSIDVQQLTYLAGVECLATDENRLLEVGRELVGAFHPEKRVVSYEELLKRLGIQA